MICNNLVFEMLKNILNQQHTIDQDKYKWNIICINGNHECTDDINPGNPGMCSGHAELYYQLFNNKIFRFDDVAGDSSDVDASTYREKYIEFFSVF